MISFISFQFNETEWKQMMNSIKFSSKLLKPFIWISCFQSFHRSIFQNRWNNSNSIENASFPSFLFNLIKTDWKQITNSIKFSWKHSNSFIWIGCINSFDWFSTENYSFPSFHFNLMIIKWKQMTNSIKFSWKQSISFIWICCIHSFD